MSRRPVGIDLFAGAGGFSLGFEQAGFDVVSAVEIDPIHAAIHEFNFPKCATLARSVVGLSSEGIREAANLSGPVDVVFGGAPCQGFSLIGQWVLDDPRNNLVREYLRIVTELEASYFVFENVKGLTVGRHVAFLEELVRTFQSNGYDILLPWNVLNACNFSVPQHRERLFLIGARRGLPLPTYPMPTSYRSKRAQELSLLDECPTCGDALDDIPDAELFDELNFSDEAQAKKWGASSAYAKTLRCELERDWHFGYRREWDSRMLSSSMRTRHSAISPTPVS